MDCNIADLKQYKYDEISNKMMGCRYTLRTLERIPDGTDGTNDTDGTNERTKRLHTNTFLTTTNTITNITLSYHSNQHERVGALLSHHPGCDYTSVGLGKDTHGTRGPLRRKAVGGPNKQEQALSRLSSRNKNSPHCHHEIIQKVFAGVHKGQKPCACKGNASSAKKQTETIIKFAGHEGDLFLGRELWW